MAGLGRWRNQYIDDVIVDQNWRHHIGAAAAAARPGEQSVVDENIAIDLMNAALLDLTSKGVEAGERIGVHQLTANAKPVGVNVVVVGEEEPAGRPRPAAERKVAMTNENKIAVQPAVDHVAAAIDGRLKAMVGAEDAKGGGAGVELGDGSGSEELVGIVFVDGEAGFAIDDEDAPTAMFIVGRIENGVDFGGEVVFGADGAQSRRPARRTKQERV